MQKKKVGSVIVKKNKIISSGYNKTPCGFNNACENKYGETKWYVIHAEENAILKTTYNNISCKDSSIYVTYFPCKKCSKLIYLSKIKRIIILCNKKKYSYNRKKNSEKLIFFKKLNIKIEKISIFLN